ncbi:MAG: ATP-binding cassette domain-containing protein [Candidatus Marinimicrobia bacterium]|nr:ATP-binding cassette domain-containing protein [Candidatus Neomarinimicrobiota bacterium]MBL7022651.1 ATP-binding cassette domain-containing protein [Candidatus Neomarinimicrobiota bacterium]MBL7109925.1 ATP-binding cassette domain-containing protein [Candidatus Neomarinimicrobiota bacterium]
MISFENVTATYSKDVGIFNLSFHIPSGEMVFIMGPTGAGKSTVLRAIYNDIQISNGKIIVDGEDITKLKQRQIPYYRRKIGMIFQDFKLLPDRTLFENVALPLRILGTPKKIIVQKVRDTLDKVGLVDKWKELPNQLSGGEQQRVSIARALVKDPIIILADEPTGNLDLNISDEILDIMEMVTKSGTSVLMCTHNFPLVRPRKKNFLELSKGRLL